MGNCAWFGSPVPLPTPRGVTGAPLSCSIPTTASCSSPVAPFHQKPPWFCRDLPIPAGFGCSRLFTSACCPFHRPWSLEFSRKFGLGAGPAGFGGKQAFGMAQVGFASPWLSPLRCVFGEGERQHTPSSSCEANRVSQLVSKWCPRGAATRGAGAMPCTRAMLASAVIQDFCSGPLTPFDPRPPLQGAILLCFSPWKCSVLDGGVGF